MFWDRVAGVYDIFTEGLNRRAHRELKAIVGELVSKEDRVLECACGTGLLTRVLAPRCHALVATDYSGRMLERARKKCGEFSNVEFCQADICALDFPSESFDRVVAANVIHLLPDPEGALKEMGRVCRRGGSLILPTYINQDREGHTSAFAGLLGAAGAGFQRQFTLESYQRFLEKAGYRRGEYHLARGRIPCAVAVIRLE